MSLWKLCPNSLDQSAVITQARGAKIPNWLMLYFRHVIAAEHRPDQWEALETEKAGPEIETHPARFGRTKRRQHNIPIMLVDCLRLPDCGLLILNDDEMIEEAFFGAIGTINRCRPALALNRHSGAIDLVRRYGFRRREQLQGFIFYTLEHAHA